MTVKKIEEVKIDEFPNYRFTILRGENKDRFVDTLVDLPFMNPHDWIILYEILKKHESKIGSQLLHIIHMIRNYCMEVSKMDVEVSKSMKKKSTVKPQDQLEGLEELRKGLIQIEPWRIVYNVLEEAKVQNKHLYMDEKHCYSFDCLSIVLLRVEMYKANTKEYLKWVSKVIRWWIQVRIVLMEIPREVFGEQKGSHISQLNT